MLSSQCPPAIGQLAGPPPAPYHASRWATIALLINEEEMAELLSFLPPCFFYATHGLLKREEIAISHSEWHESYSYYVGSLKNGQLPADNTLRRFFYAALTADSQALVAYEMDKGRNLIRPLKPIIQLQPYRFLYTSSDKQCRPMPFSPQAISWGIQLSFPFAFQANSLAAIEKTLPSDLNAQLFRSIQQWLRKNTRPTPLLIEEKAHNLPCRISMRNYDWLSSHPQLIEKGWQLIV